MARKIRLEYAGAVYHIISRGDRREAIFLSDADRHLFMDTLEEACVRSGFIVHTYALMSNHIHILMETPEPNLIAGMHWLLSTYTMRFNWRHDMVGHLFQGRYKAIPIDMDKGDYFRVVSEYIHLNPVRARMLDKATPCLGSYQWSSYSTFIGAAPLPTWMVRDRIFEVLGLRGDSPSDRRRYRERMNKRVNDYLSGKSSLEMDKEWREIRKGWYLGGEAFRDRLEDLASKVVEGKKRSSFDSCALVRHDEEHAEKLLAMALHGLDLDEERLRLLRCSDPLKQLVVWLLRSRTTVVGTWIDSRLNIGNASNISRAVAAYRSPSDLRRKQLKSLMLQICKD